MKFWRRHKHELTHSDADAPLPQPPDKKMRYSREDDILLAKYFYDKPEGTSDSIFQAFGRQVRRVPFLLVPVLMVVALVPASSVEGVAGASSDP